MISAVAAQSGTAYTSTFRAGPAGTWIVRLPAFPGTVWDAVGMPDPLTLTVTEEKTGRPEKGASEKARETGPPPRFRIIVPSARGPRASSQEARVSRAAAAAARVAYLLFIPYLLSQSARRPRD